MQKEFVNFEIAVELKELGFDGQCFAFYFDGEFRILHQFNNLDINSRSNSEHHKLNSTMNLYAAPLWQQAIDWLREKQNAFACPIFDQISGKGYWCTFGIMGKSCDSEWDFDTYEDAREYAILKAIELCKNNS